MNWRLQSPNIHIEKNVFCHWQVLQKSFVKKHHRSHSSSGIGCWWNFDMMSWWYNLFRISPQVGGDFSSENKWKLKQMCERRGTDDRSLPSSRRSLFLKGEASFLLCQEIGRNQTCKMAKRRLIRNLSICRGLNHRSAALQVGWHQNLSNQKGPRSCRLLEVTQKTSMIS